MIASLKTIKLHVLFPPEDPLEDGRSKHLMVATKPIVANSQSLATIFLVYKTKVH
jgi:hypothetical protein